MSMASDGGGDSEDRIGIEELGWKAEEILMALSAGGGTLNIGEIRERTGIESLGSLNYQIKSILDDGGLVETMHPEYDGGLSKGKVITLTEAGSSVADRLGSGEDEDGEGSVESLGDRVDRLEAKRNSAYGTWGKEKREEYEDQLELTRLLRDFVWEKYGDEFEEYIRENSS